MRSVVIIPSRLNSLRLPQKPLISISGKTLIQRVYEQIKKCENKIDCIVATDSKKIYDHVKSFNGEVVMTSEKHISGTDRVNEALSLLNNSYDLIINVQGDEPIINPGLIDDLINSFCLKSDEILTPAKKTSDIKEIDNQNIVKVEFDSKMIATKFYRHNNINKEVSYKHIGVYVFTTKILTELCNLKPTENEIRFNLEQLRWMDNNYKIKILPTSHNNLSIDTKDDVEKLYKKFSEKL